MESCWSFQTFQGAPTARLTTHMTIGSLAPDAHCTCSCMYSSPLALVAVKVRAPAEDAAMQTASAECSLSTGIYSAFISPDSTYSESFSVSGV
ncbi:MAG: hypothetical protein BWX45_00895 [Deltaproteobacteria bacterium ADurb.Bin002]|nr:MAG: hypothetical protein BWX45_00895 [Deltaproteobacteria bacterium ADurb.Bin002]